MIAPTPGNRQHLDARSELAGLCAPLQWPQAACGPYEFELVHADALPAPARQLLAHHNHMTTVLQAYYDEALELAVLEEHRAADEYWRKIVLRLARRRVVAEFGIVRIRLAGLAPVIRDEILARQRPLGEILIRHDVLRWIEPSYFLRFSAGTAIAGFFPDVADASVYGRLGVIHCDGQPAIRLLEVVRPGD